MSEHAIQLRKITFKGPSKKAELELKAGVNVICGASDTGKSFLAESLDFMLGGSNLRDIPERTPYGSATLELADTDDCKWILERAISGGNFTLREVGAENDESEKLSHTHSHEKVDNLSGFLLDKIGLLGKRILKSGVKGTTQSLSFRNLARLVIVQEGEIQQTGSPFWGGQFTLKTPELATIKLLLTGVDDSDVVSNLTTDTDNIGQIAILDELLAEIDSEITDLGESKTDLDDQLDRLEASIDAKRESLAASQHRLNELLSQRRELFEERQKAEGRQDEISNLLVRFALLSEHYAVDMERLAAIKESGSMFAHVEKVSCPLCGAKPDDQHIQESCDGDVESIVQAASAEMLKIERLQSELEGTVSDLKAEKSNIANVLSALVSQYNILDQQIQQSVAPEVSDMRSSFTSYVEERSKVRESVALFNQQKNLQDRKAALEKDEAGKNKKNQIATGLPDSVAHDFSLRLSRILKAWDFPGDCHVHFDKETTDFVIDGKPRGSRGKGLRAITHAAVTIALLEYCQENKLPHPGFVVLDSPLLAYFKPEGDEDKKLQGTDLKENFYEYLIEHHRQNSQIVIIENQHPPESVHDKLSLTIFTGNPDEGRYGFLE